MPRRYLKNIEDLLISIRSKTSPEEYAGQTFVYSLLVSLLLLGISLVLGLPIVYFIVLPVLGFSITQLFLYFILFVAADKRAKEIEGYLPDALTLISANLRAGMTVDKAIWSATRPEFGPLEEELSELGRDVVGGKTFSEALVAMGKRVKSDIVKQTIKLIDEGIISGGGMENLLREIAQDIRTAERLKDEIKANVAMYVIFMFFAAVLAAPLLFGLSSKLIEMSGMIREPIKEVPAGGIPGSPIKVPISIVQMITPDQILIFFVAEIIIITTFSGLALGLIQEGSEKRGLRYIPILILIGLVIFFMSKTIMGLILFI